MIKEIRAKSALHYHSNKFATNWDVNIYRGCGHGCTYCFARYSHRYLDDHDFFADIYVKTNIATQLDREFSRRGRVVEPCSPPAKERLNMLSSFLKAGCRTGVLVMPIIPYLKDSEENLREIFELARENQVNLVETGTLHLRGSTRYPFMNMIRNCFPEIYGRLDRLYNGANASEEYKSILRPLILRHHQKFGPWPEYTPPEPARQNGAGRQLRLFQESDD